MTEIPCRTRRTWVYNGPVRAANNRIPAVLLKTPFDSQPTAGPENAGLEGFLPESSPPPPPAPAGRNRARVVTEPASAARVSVDGIERGVTPLTLTDLAPGEHDVVVRNQGAVHRRAMAIERGATASLVISTDAEGVS